MVKRLHHEPVSVARRGTPRAINRQILLNLVRAWQPVSRADLARLMSSRRGAVSLIVNGLIAEGILFEGAKGESPRGRKPKFLYIDSRKRTVIAVDVRPTQTYTMVTNLLTEPIVGVSSFPTQPDPARSSRLSPPGSAHDGGPSGTRAVRGHRPRRAGHGLPRRAPASRSRRGWAGALPAARSAREGHRASGTHRELRAGLRHRPGVGRAPRGRPQQRLRVPLRVGRPRRGHRRERRSAARPAQRGGRVRPRAARGRGAALRVRRHRVLGGLRLEPRHAVEVLRPESLAAQADSLRDRSFSVDDLVARARGGDSKAVSALQSTAHYLGLGLASVVNAVDPERIFISGEIIAAWT